MKAKPNGNRPAVFPEVSGNISTMLSMQRDYLQFWLRNRYQLGDTYIMKMGFRKFLVLNHPEHASDVLGRRQEAFSGRTFVSDHVDLLNGGKTLFTQHGQEWKKNRRNLQPYFSSSRLAAEGSMLSELSTSIGSYVEGILGQNAAKDDSLSLRGFTREGVVLPVGRFLFKNLEEHESTELAKSALSYIDHATKGSLFAALALLPSAVLKVFAPFLERDFRWRRRQLSDRLENFSKRLRTHREKSLEISIAQYVNLYLGGIDTTAASLAFCLTHLWKHPSWARRIGEFAQQLSSEEIERIAWSGSPVLDAVINESQRLTPVVAILPKKSISAETYLYDNTVVAPNTNVLICFASIHRHPDFWLDPDTFQPSRWFSDRKRSPFQYIPFGGGVRRCLGERLALLEIRLFLIHIFARFNIRSLVATEGKIDDVEVFTTLEPNRHIEIQFEVR